MALKVVYKRYVNVIKVVDKTLPMQYLHVLKKLNIAFYYNNCY